MFTQVDDSECIAGVAMDRATRLESDSNEEHIEYIAKSTNSVASILDITQEDAEEFDDGFLNNTEFTFLSLILNKYVMFLL